MIRGLEDGLDYKDSAFVNEMSECPIQGCLAPYGMMKCHEEPCIHR